jgi:oligopeptide/dipeptide ABC transporter ATP-binding protein
LGVGETLLRVENLEVSVVEGGCSVRIVEGVSFRVHEGEVVGLIGPTGTGKTVTAMAVLGLLGAGWADETSWRLSGEVLYRGRDLMRVPDEGLRLLRGDEISAIFQKPRRSLNPMLVIGVQTGEPLEAHEEVERRRLREIVVEYLGMVELPDPEERFHFYRHQFSGGEAQRIMIAMALICGPSLLIADEPTSDLDVTVQRQVLELLKRMREDFGLAMLLITHDLGVIAEMSDWVYVMYAGRIVEHGDVETIFGEPKHPYTRGLLRSVPRLDSERVELVGIPGEAPQPPYNIPGCTFHPRCDHAGDRCRGEPPQLREIEPRHSVACLRAGEI